MKFLQNPPPLYGKFQNFFSDFFWTLPLVEDKAVEKIEEVVRQNVKVAMENINFEC